MWQTEQQGTLAISIIYSVQSDNDHHLAGFSSLLYQSQEMTYFSILTIPIVKHNLPFSADSVFSNLYLITINIAFTIWKNESGGVIIQSLFLGIKIRATLVMLKEDTTIFYNIQKVYSSTLFPSINSIHRFFFLSFLVDLPYSQRSTQINSRNSCMITFTTCLRCFVRCYTEEKDI